MWKRDHSDFLRCRRTYLLHRIVISNFVWWLKVYDDMIYDRRDSTIEKHSLYNDFAIGWKSVHFIMNKENGWLFELHRWERHLMYFINQHGNCCSILKSFVMLCTFITQAKNYLIFWAFYFKFIFRIRIFNFIKTYQKNIKSKVY